MIEHTILSHLVFNEAYTRKVIAFLKDEYFQDKNERLVFKLIHRYINKYNALPTKEALYIDLSNVEGINQEILDKAKDIITDLGVDETTKLEWLVDETEKFCQEKALFNAIMRSIRIIDKKETELTKGAIPKILQDALSVSFDTNIGHDFLEDWERRFEFYNAVEERIRFDLDYFNRITNGGLPKKTLNVILAGTGVGKTRFMCHMATANLRDHKNVLYITLEMEEFRIAERIDANLLDIPIADLALIPKATFQKAVEREKEHVRGKLIVKEYPPATVSAAHFRHLLNELKLKKNFVPDIVYIDYINLCSSARMKYGSNVNSYLYIKAVAEEIRGLAVEFNVPIVSATQTNRTGYNSSDIGLDDTSESFGLPMTVDFMVAMSRSDELDDLNQVMVKQLKNRYSDPSMYRRFVIGIDKQKMRYYDVEQSAQEDISDGPIMDNTNFGHDWNEEERALSLKGNKFNMDIFKDFK